MGEGAKAAVVVGSEGRGLMRGAARAASYNAEARTVEAVISSERPVEMMDYDVWEYVPEVLLASGLRMPEGRSQVPLIDGHRSWGSVANVLGSVVGVRQEGELSVATLRFADTEEARRAESLVRDGHVTDVSVGYTRGAVTRIGEGSRASVGGREYEGPKNVVSEWTLLEVSVCAIGANGDATVRSKDRRNNGGDGSGAKGGAGVMENAGTENKPAVVPPVAVDEGVAERARQEGVRAELERQRGIRGLVELATRAGTAPEEGVVRGWLEDPNVSVGTVQKALVEASQRSAPVLPVAPQVRLGETDVEKRHAEAVEAMVQLLGGERAKPGNRFAGLRLRGFIEEFAEAGGVVPSGHARRMGAEQCAEAMARHARSQRGRLVLGVRGGGAMSSRSFGHTTSDLPSVFLDAANKVIMGGYTLVEPTYKKFCGTTVVTDFKPVNLIGVSDVGMPQLVNEAGEIPLTAVSDQRTSLSVKTYGERLSISRQMIVNDDLGALSRVLSRMGAVFAQFKNRLVYQAFMANPTVLGAALFHADHANLNAGAGGALSETSLQTAISAMQDQESYAARASDKMKLNIVPKFIVVPPALRWTALKLLNSSSIAPATAGNSGTVNTVQGLVEPIVDAELANTGNTGYSSTAWYLFADPALTPTIEVGLLNGVDGITVDEDEEFDTLGMKYRAYMDFGVGFADYRGTYKSDGVAAG